jgi:uncharacterized protein
VVTDLVEIGQLSEAKKEENVRFRRYLSIHKFPEHTLRELAHEVEKQIDCRACANCCRQTSVDVSPAEIRTIARYLDTDPEKAAREYTTTDPKDGRTTLRQSGGACVFLDGNLCMIYEARPRPCRDFPHLVTIGRSLGSRMASICRRACICPIVYNTLEDYKRLTGYHPPKV